MKEINPAETSRAQAFGLWMSSPMPMVTLTKTFDISNIVKSSTRRNLKLNMLLCWCIGKAASQTEHFYLLPAKDTMLQYDKLAINVIVDNKQGGINSCDIPYTDDIMQFNRDYLTLTQKVADSCESVFEDDSMIIGTSAMVATELDCIVNQYTDKFFNPMVMWGKYRKRWFKTSLPISFQFHHVQMDGGDAAKFLELLQKVIHALRIDH